MGMTASYRRFATGILVLVALAVTFAGVFRWMTRPSQPDVDPRRFDGTQAMAERLKEFAGELITEKVLQITPPTSGLVRYYAGITEGSDDRRRVLVEARKGDVLLADGHIAEAIEQYGLVRSLAEQKPGTFDRNFFLALRDALGIAYMRLGEQQNCLEQHTADSCLLPIQGEGIHRLQEGSRFAVREYEQLLEEDPGNLTARWLLNIAYMTLGEYPDRVPARWLIPPQTFASTGDVGRFPDVAAAVGVAASGHAGGAIMEDFDRDGYLDIMASSQGLRDQIHYFRNNGDGTFTDATTAAGLTGITGGLNIIQADYDNDGFPDVLVLRGAWLQDYGRHPRSLLHNRGDGTFEDVTVKAGLLSFNPTQAAAWGDYDNDGWIDLFIGNETYTPTGLWNVLKNGLDDYPERLPSLRRRPSHLYHNNHDGTFTDVAADAGLDVLGFVKGAAWGDYDNDGRLDLSVTFAIEQNRLFRNLGPDGSGRVRFEDVTRRANAGGPVFAFPTWFFDYNNDGWLDLFVADLTPDPVRSQRKAAGYVAAEYLGMPRDYQARSLLRNNGDGTFTNVTAEMGLDHVLYTMGANFGDLDNDGYPDIYLATGNPDYRTLVPNRMFRNDEGRRFQDVTTSGGFGHLQKGHGVAFGDIDNDGDQDVYVVMGGGFPGDVATNALFLNPGHPGNHWITLVLEGVRSNRAAIGTRIKVTVETPAGPRDIYAVVSTGGSFGSSSLQQEIGLGAAKIIRALEVRWPASGTVQTFTEVPMDAFLKIREGATSFERLTRKAFRISTEPGPDATSVHALHHH
jgi:hypothetical protein